MGGCVHWRTDTHITGWHCDAVHDQLEIAHMSQSFAFPIARPDAGATARPKRTRAAAPQVKAADVGEAAASAARAALEALDMPPGLRKKLQGAISAAVGAATRKKPRVGDTGPDGFSVPPTAQEQQAVIVRMYRQLVKALPGDRALQQQFRAGNFDPSKHVLDVQPNERFSLEMVDGVIGRESLFEQQWNDVYNSLRGHVRTKLLRMPYPGMAEGDGPWATGTHVLFMGDPEKPVLKTTKGAFIQAPVDQLERRDDLSYVLRDAAGAVVAESVILRFYESQGPKGFVFKKLTDVASELVAIQMELSKPDRSVERLKMHGYRDAKADRGTSGGFPFDPT